MRHTRRRRAAPHATWRRAGRALALLGLLLGLLAGHSGAQTQQPPPSGGLLEQYGIVCNGVTPTAARLQQALDSIPTGTRLTLPGGICLLEAPVTIGHPVALEGAGLNLTQLRSTVPDQPVLIVNSASVTVSGLFVTHSGVTVTTGGHGLVVQSGFDAVFLDHISSQFNDNGFLLGSIAFGSAAHLIASLNNGHGFQFLYAAPYNGCQWDVRDSISQQNKGAGFVGAVRPEDLTGLGPFLTQTTSFANREGGYIFTGLPGKPLSDVRLNNVLSSYDNDAGIYFDTYGASHLILNPWIEQTGRITPGSGVWGADLTPVAPTYNGHCLAVSVHNLQGMVITGGLYWNCSWSGVALDAPSSALVGGASYDNGQSRDANLSRRAGVAIGGNGITVSGHTFDTLTDTTAHYLWLSGSINGLSIGHNTFKPGVLNYPDFVGVDPATVFTGPPATMVGGLSVFTNKPGSPGLLLYDANPAVATPVKLLLISQGELQVRNAAGDKILSRLSDAGTPSWPERRGQITVSGGTTVATVTLASAEPDTSYFVQLTPVQATGSPPSGAFTINGVTKTTTTFQVSVVTAPGGGNAVTYDWLVYR